MNDFLVAATWHGSLDEANAMLVEHPAIASSGIHVAAVLGDDGAVRDRIARDRQSATAKAGPYGRVLSSTCRSIAEGCDASCQASTA